MKLTSLLHENLIKLKLDGSTKQEILNELIGMLDQNGLLNDKQAFKKAVDEREAQGSTGVGFGIAIPHGKTDAVKETAVVFGKKTAGVDWDSLDGEDATLFFMIAVPEKNAGDEHLKILQLLSRKLIDNEFRESLLRAPSKDDVMKLLDTI
ncbi:PTS sugar transporter subunit IIA [Aneurinibacillus terranovensis]|uniref:PTS sugar transporter subunit IIA n=1 Tax=Aneurinibacillus terranovensis TaxID=278991 RepID=UPI00040F5934|nr:fructose PTS transporter subunit IIA [Aneurinibacillus terranovensis]